MRILLSVTIFAKGSLVMAGEDDVPRSHCQQ
jgi:hypothetical protein